MNDTQVTPAAGDAASIRRAHLNHEANIKAFGLLYYIGAVLGGLTSIMLIFMVVFMHAAKGRFDAYFPVFMIAFSVFYFWVARGLRALDPAVKIPAGVLAAVGLLGFPIGTLINGYLLYLLFSEKGTMVFSDEYKQVIAATPDIKYRTSIIVWFFLALLVLVILLGVAAALVHH